jgi:hypothetical protein
VVYRRAAIAEHPKVCGLSLIEWLAGTRVTGTYPASTRSALKAWSTAKMNLANFGCATPLEQDTQASEAFAAIAERYVLTDADVADDVKLDACLGRGASELAEELPYWVYVLNRWNAGEGNVTQVSPCDCSLTECATQFGLVDDDGSVQGADTDTPVKAASDSALARAMAPPQEWDAMKLTFFVTTCVLLVAFVVVTLLCLRLMCTNCVRMGPTGFSTRAMFSQLHTGATDAGTLPHFELLGDMPQHQ